jgi:hypothetical protein
MVIYSLLPSLL